MQTEPCVMYRWTVEDASPKRSWVYHVTAESPLSALKFVRLCGETRRCTVTRDDRPETPVLTSPLPHLMPKYCAWCRRAYSYALGRYVEPPGLPKDPNETSGLCSSCAAIHFPSHEGVAK